MDLQNKILKNYKELNQSPTLKQMAQDTGINQTRIFRIINGSPMKLSEYEIFERRVKERSGQNNDLRELITKLEVRAPNNEILKLKKLVERKLKFLNIMSLSNQMVF